MADELETLCYDCGCSIIDGDWNKRPIEDLLLEELKEVVMSCIHQWCYKDKKTGLWDGGCLSTAEELLKIAADHGWAKTKDGIFYELIENEG